MVGTYNSSTHTLKIYLNGAYNNGTITTTGTMFQSTGGFQLGTANSTYVPHGYLDEVRLSNIVRSDDWIKTEYNNQNAPDKATYGASGFYTIGSQMSR